MKPVKFERNGKENGKMAYLVKRRFAGLWITFATIVFDGSDWVFRLLRNDRIERFEKLREAKEEALKALTP